MATFYSILTHVSSYLELPVFDQPPFARFSLRYHPVLAAPCDWRFSSCKDWVLVRSSYRLRNAKPDSILIHG